MRSWLVGIVRSGECAGAISMRADVCLLHTVAAATLMVVAAAVGGGGGNVP